MERAPSFGGTSWVLSRFPAGIIQEPFFYVKPLEKRLRAGYNGATMAPRKKDPHAVALGRKGGLKGGKKGGKARWAGVPPEERSAILRRAVQARWQRQRDQAGSTPAASRSLMVQGEMPK